MTSTAQDAISGSEGNELAQFKQLMYDNYDQTHCNYSDHGESVWEARFRGHVSVLRSMLPPNKTAPILDLGCGDGLLLAVAQSLGYTDLSGVELSDTLMTPAARRSSPSTFSST
ncbi:MAG: class I SAM-dependent methyltransferase [Beijerinckiaceae bacterium]|nr:class I SAM-dependent methyltransferase [Beijerinckiaceae bacterium]MCI0736704.1 class I SAM-dependent methyltransferase [Beijerinckiaceae bacterium]